MRPANFEIVQTESTPEILVIRDLGPWNRVGTITNDAEGVVERLVRAGQLPSGRRLLYYDSDGDKDEIRVKDGQFAGFVLMRSRGL